MLYFIKGCFEFYLTIGMRYYYVVVIFICYTVFEWELWRHVMDQWRHRFPKWRHKRIFLLYFAGVFCIIFRCFSILLLFLEVNLYFIHTLVQRLDLARSLVMPFIQQRSLVGLRKPLLKKIMYIKNTNFHQKQSSVEKKYPAVGDRKRCETRNTICGSKAEKDKLGKSKEQCEGWKCLSFAFNARLW